jgi:hypothetical protein
VEVRGHRRSHHPVALGRGPTVGLLKSCSHAARRSLTIDRHQRHSSGEQQKRQRKYDVDTKKTGCRGQSEQHEIENNQAGYDDSLVHRRECSRAAPQQYGR